MNTYERVAETRGSILLIQAVDYDTRTLSGFQPLCAPVSIATVAALTPDSFEVDLWDENLDGLLDATSVLRRDHYDIVGISTLFEQVGRRVPVLAALFRSRGAYICAGGPGISNQRSLINSAVDSVFLNEAEYTWPEFLSDWLRGRPKREYIQIAKPDLTTSPAPKWGALADRIPLYRAAGVQTTRGCPFDCEFCDVIYLYGRAQRHKSVEQVLHEVANLQKLGAKRVFFTDDEFVGDPRYTRALLERLIPLNNSFASPLAFHTQLTMNLANHNDLLEALADANFWHALIGIESFNEASLKETNKIQNCRRDIVADCRKILSYGIGINGSLIVGFDNDGSDVFDRILENIQRACVPFASVSILRATYGTKLWTRMRENRRLWRLRNADALPQALQVDILPRGELTRADLIKGRIYLNKQLSDIANLCERLRGWVSLVERLPQVTDPLQLQLDEAVALIRDRKALSLTQRELTLIEETLEYARDEAPVMMGRLVDSVLSQVFWYRIRTLHSEEDLNAALAAENEGDLVADQRPILLPSGFATAFKKELFAFVYSRLQRTLTSATEIPEAASEVFVDFLVRLSDESSTMPDKDFASAHHKTFLGLLCDRASARLMGRAPESLVVEEPCEAELPKGLKRSGLYDAVLKEVGDRLSRLSSSEA